MTKEESLLAGRILDLANKSYRQNIYTFTDFLGLSEQSVFFTLKNEIGGIPCRLWGGGDNCERVMIRFGDADTFGYEEEFPISCIHIEPKMEKFSDELTHRDYLGAIMNLGIERSLLGDIIVGKNEAFVFCKSTIAEYLMENLIKIKHTLIVPRLLSADESDEPLKQIVKTQIKEVQVSSERLDGIISKIYNLSRDKSNELFYENKVFINGRLTTGNATKPKPNDIVSVRGFGRFKYFGELRTTKKGKLVVSVGVFV